MFRQKRSIEKLLILNICHNKSINRDAINGAAYFGVRIIEVSMKKLVTFIVLAFLAGCGSESSDDINHVFVYKDDGAVQCETAGMSPEDSAQPLIDIGIDVLESNCGYLSDIAIAAQCGLGDSNINLHSIDVQSLVDVEDLGFFPVSSLSRNGEDGYVIIGCLEPS
jgi:hypothetical protein